MAEATRSHEDVEGGRSCPAWGGYIFPQGCRVEFRTMHQLGGTCDGFAGEAGRKSRWQASRSAVRHLVSRFFRNSPELLVLNLLEDEELSRKELRRIRALLAGEEK